MCIKICATKINSSKSGVWRQKILVYESFNNNNANDMYKIIEQSIISQMRTVA